MTQNLVGKVVVGVSVALLSTSSITLMQTAERLAKIETSLDRYAQELDVNKHNSIRIAVLEQRVNALEKK